MGILGFQKRLSECELSTTKFKNHLSIPTKKKKFIKAGIYVINAKCLLRLHYNSGYKFPHEDYIVSLNFTSCQIFVCNLASDQLQNFINDHKLSEPDSEKNFGILVSENLYRSANSQQQAYCGYTFNDIIRV